jgi:hypothetical protein
LQVTLGALSPIPAASGITGMLVGPSTIPQDDSKVETSLDSEYRFTNAFWFATAPIIWSTLPKIEQRSTVLRATLGTVFVGGIARVLSWQRNGTQRGVRGVDRVGLVGMPIILAWHNRVRALAERTDPDPS